MWRKDIESQEFERSLLSNDIDIRVSGLIDNLDVKGKKTLEIGCLDGFHTRQLAEAGAIVTTTDIRPEGLKRALYRCLYFDINNVNFRILDMDNMHEVIGLNEFNVCFHSGCFYHIQNPVKHLFDIAPLFEYVLLETHLANPNKYSIGTLEYNDKIYNGTLYPEGEWSDLRAAKNNKFSFWLTKESLLQLFKDCNLEVVKTVYDNFPNEHGPRACYLLKRS